MLRAEVILHRYLGENSGNSAFVQALEQFQKTLNAVKVAYTTLAAEKRYSFISPCFSIPEIRVKTKAEC